MKGPGIASLCSFGVALLGCATAEGRNPSRTYKPSEVVRNIDSLRGQTIRVSGYLILGDEARALWDSKADAEQAGASSGPKGESLFDHCITAYYDERGAAAIGRRHPAHIVAIGKVGFARDDDDKVDLWACSDAYLTIQDVVPQG